MLFVYVITLFILVVLFTPTKLERRMIRECKRRLHQAHDNGEVWTFGTTSPLVLLGVTLFSTRRQFKNTKRRVVAGVATYTNGDWPTAAAIAERTKQVAAPGKLAFVAVLNKPSTVVMASAGPEGVDANGAATD